VAITEVIVRNKNLNKNLLILPVDLFGLNPKQTRHKNCKKRWSPRLLITGRCIREEGGEGPYAAARISNSFLLAVASAQHSTYVATGSSSRVATPHLWHATHAMQVRQLQLLLV
jgi:hypothetical protein